MILVFGKTGQVGRELSLLPNTSCYDRDQADLSQPESCFDLIMQNRPDAVINAAAYTNVDQAELHESLAFIVNAEAPRAMARACNKLNIPFVHISTDYVFSGDTASAYLPDEEVNPLNAYGRTKAAGERAVLEEHNWAVVLRTSWVFSAHGKNFVKTMLNLAETHPQLQIVDDQYGGPTSAKAIAQVCVNISSQMQQDRKKTGIFHFTGYPTVTWAEFGKHFLAENAKDVVVKPIPSEHFPTRAMRPKWSVLDCQSLQCTFGVSQPRWKCDLKSVLTTLGIKEIDE